MTTRAKKRIALLLTIIVVGAAGLYLASEHRQSTRIKAIEEAKDAGMAAHEAGDDVAAVQKLGFYLSQEQQRSGGEPVDGEVQLIYARHRLEVPEENNRHIGRAMQAARNARQLMPDDPGPLELLLDIYSRQNMMSEQLEAAEALLAIDEDNFEAHQHRALAQFRLGDRDAAIETAKEAAERRPDDLRAHELVIVLLNQALAPPEEIRAYAERMAEMHPDDPEFLFLKAGANLSIGDEETAREVVSRAIELPIESSEAFRKSLVLLDQLRMNDEATALLERTLGSSTKAGEYRVIAAERLWQSGRPQDARRALERADADLNEASDAYLGWLSLLQVDEMPVDQEPEALSELRRRSTDVASQWRTIVDAYRLMRSEDWAAARDQLRMEAGDGRPQPVALYLLGECERQLGEWRRAVEIWTRLAERSPNWVNLRLSLSSTLLAHEEILRALGYAFEALQAAPNQIVAVPATARAVTAYLETSPGPDDPRRAFCLDFLEQCRAQFAQSAEIKALLARSYAAIGEDDRARSLIEELVAATDDASGRDDGGAAEISAASMNALLTVSRQREWGLEERIVSLGSGEADRSPSLLFVIASEFARAGDPEEGKRLLQEAVSSHEGDLRREFERRLAVYLDRIGDPEAGDLLRRLAEEQERSAQAQLDLLESSSAWRDPDTVRLAVQRLRNLAGEASTEWRLYEARRLLTFDPSDKNTAQVYMLLNEIVKDDSEAVEARRLLAESLLLSGQARDRSKASELLEEAVRAAPERADIHARLVSVLQEAGEAERAAQRLEAFAELDDVSDPMKRRRAQLAAEQGMWSLAIRDITSLRSAMTSDRVTLGSLYWKSGAVEEAMRVFASLIEQEDVEPRALRAAAEFFASQGDMDRAQGLIDRLPDDPPGRRALASAQVYEQQRMFDEAGERYQAYVDAAGTADAWSELARFQFRRGMMTEAARSAARGLELDDAHRPLRITERTIRLARGETLDAAAVEEMLAVVGGDDSPSQLTGPAGALLQIINDLQASPDEIRQQISKLREMIQENPTFWPARRVLCGALVTQGNVDAAAEEAVSATRALPADPRPAQLATELLAGSNQISRAIVMGRTWLDRSRDEPLAASAALARLELRRNNFGEALNWLAPVRDRIERDAERRPDLLSLLVRALALAGRSNEAQNLIGPYAASDEEWAMRYMNVARSLTARPEVGAVWIERAAEHLDELPRSLIVVGQAWYELGNATGDERYFRTAAETLRHALDDADVGAEAAGLSAASIEAAGDLEEAERLYRLALERSQDNPAVLNNLAFLLVKTDGSMDEALSLATRAVDLAPQVPTFLDTKGVALLRLAQYAEAETVFRGALDLDSSDPALHLGLAEALAGQEKFEEARSRLEQVRVAIGQRPLGPHARARYEALQSQLQGERAEADGR